MDIKPPYGYQDIVPLTKTHRVVMPDGRKLPLVFRSLHAIPVSMTEFIPACRDYPIAFVSGDEGASFVAMAILGLEGGQNLVRARRRHLGRRGVPPRLRAALPLLHDAGDGGRQGAAGPHRLRREAGNQYRGQRPARRSRHLPAGLGRAQEAVVRVRGRSRPQRADVREALGARPARALHNAGAAAPGPPALDHGDSPRFRAEAQRAAGRSAQRARASRRTLTRLRAPRVARQLRPAARPPRQARRRDLSGAPGSGAVRPREQRGAGDDHRDREPLPHRQAEGEQTEKPVRLARIFDGEAERAVPDEE